MFLSKTNALRESNLTISGGDSQYPVSNMLLQDFSLEYWGTGQSDLTFTLGFDADYIAFAGAYYGKCSTVRISYDLYGAPFTVDHTPRNDSVLGFVFPDGSTNQVLTFVGTAAPIAIAHLAAGDTLEVPGGEQAGYKRLWSTPASQSRTQTNKGIPTATVLQSVALSSQLNVNNVTTEFVRNEWYDFMSNAIRNGFYIFEDDNYPDSTYYGYGVAPTPATAHATTRALQNVSLKFDAWTGRTL